MINSTVKEIIDKLMILLENAVVEIETVYGYESCEGVANSVRIDKDGSVVIS